MSDIWSDAIAEAYASSPNDDVVISTLELRHPSLATPIRVVNDLGTMLETDPYAVFGHMLTLEAGAPQDGGQSVRFLACGFDFSLPDQVEGQLPSVTISIDNVAHLITPQLDALIGVKAKLEVTYREYLISDPSAPQALFSGLSMSNVKSNLTRLTGTATFANLINRNFPSKVYRGADFPGLIQ